ncbi:response regulator [Pseudoalteromonas sp. McH1-42]|uniref:response regulator n=1 Tax=Pseudoalteromonas sp. McH1-42 TaxID=2917752 RepID=UPI001EF68CA3|nr:response regulator [Pseudoalteromonas sp. McH1-42]MCG7564385.1 response regulator [Pseudoalteromonas sp. McH1-42]
MDNGSAVTTMTILVVEAHETIRSMVANIVTGLGRVNVLQSPNGADALDKLQYQDIHLIIADWMLPKLAGIDLLKEVRKNPRTAAIPFVMTATSIQQSQVLQAIKCGVSEYVVKPFSSKIMLERLRRALNKPVRPYHGEMGEEEAVVEQPIQVLVVDDVADNIKIIGDVLRKEYKVKAALSGAKALQICAAEPQPDLVLLDIMMPGMDGLEVCRRLKDDPHTQHITVIFLTALEQTEHVVRGLELGAVDYITKPANPSVVKSRVRAHCRNIESNRLMRAQIDAMLDNARLRDEFDSLTQTNLAKPVSDIRSSTALLARHIKDPERAKRYLSYIQHSCLRLQHAMDSMSALAKIEANEYRLSPLNHPLHKVIESVLEDLAPLVEEHKVQLRTVVSKDLMFFGEPALCYTLFHNLITNALEAVNAKPLVTISAQPAEQQLTVIIQNPDPIPDGVRTRFFDKFVTFGKPDRAGVGTYTAKLLAEAQHGQIAFNTDEQRGTEVTVSLPLGEKVS